MQIVPRDSQHEQAKIAALAAQGKLTLVWNARRRVIQVLAGRSISAPESQVSEPSVA